MNCLSREFGGLFLKPLGLHLDYPFIHPLKFQFGEFPEELKWMLWYLTHLFHIGIEFHLEDLQYYVTKAIQGEISPEMKNLATFLTWFYALEQWHEMIGLDAWIHKTYPSEVSRSSCHYRSLQKYLCQINKIIPVAIWPSPEILAPWEEDKPLTPYQAQLKQALVEYQTNILDPKEWSQEYPMFCSQKAEGTSA
ncbi:hypothetical protein Gohar_020489 [Gossypium harknessii]|uniref:Uncharacterized protein n=1 Tax=Gossypium harknessii TaxID=34285 RepID=A0A7J9HXV0_9ROSI|nr:hypothetical protein [Gossypium harknessii]